jgi:hypothetical protein
MFITIIISLTSQIADLNKDGNLDIVMVSNSALNGSLLSYEIPEDFRSDEYTKHVLATGFQSRTGEFGGAPGAINLFYPQVGITCCTISYTMYSSSRFICTNSMQLNLVVKGQTSTSN